MPNYINSVNLRENSDFPYLVLDVVDRHPTPRNPGFHVFHWHHDLQLPYVLVGRVRVQTLVETVTLTAGQGCLIKPEVIHRIEGAPESHYRSFVSPVTMVTFYPGSPAERLVAETLTTTKRSILPFLNDQDWTREVNGLLRGLNELEQSKGEPLYPYQVLTALTQLWLVIEEHLPTKKLVKPTIAQLRMRQMLAFIDDHYQERLTLTEIAHAAHVGRSECSRCFQKTLATSPMRYLQEYRLEKAAKLLTTTPLPISVIANQVGFGAGPFFSKCFKRRTGVTPRQYRERGPKV